MQQGRQEGDIATYRPRSPTPTPTQVGTRPPCNLDGAG